MSRKKRAAIHTEFSAAFPDFFLKIHFGTLKHKFSDGKMKKAGRFVKKLVFIGEGL